MYRYFLMTLALLILFTSWTMAAGKVLLIGSGAPDPKDALLIDKLKSWGFTVEPHGHQEKAAGTPIKGDFDFVFISESTGSVNILGAYTDSTIPVVNAETWTFDDIGFTGALAYSRRCLSFARRPISALARKGCYALIVRKRIRSRFLLNNRSHFSFVSIDLKLNG